MVIVRTLSNCLFVLLLAAILPPQLDEIPRVPAMKGKNANKDEEWIDAKKTGIICNDVIVMVGSVTTDRVDLTEFNNSGKSPETYLILTLGLANLNPDKKVDYVGWGSRDSTYLPKLRDNLGNEYKVIHFRFTTDVVGQLKNKNLYGTEPTADVLVFERPVPTAKHLLLQLPAHNLDSKLIGENLKFRLPVKDDKVGESIIKNYEKMAADKEEARKKAIEDKMTPEEKAKKKKETELTEKKARDAKAQAKKDADERAAKSQLESAQLSLSGNTPSLRKKAFDKLRELIKSYPNTKATIEAKKLLSDNNEPEK